MNQGGTESRGKGALTKILFLMGGERGKGAIKLIILDLEEMGVPRMFEEVGKLAKKYDGN